MVRGNVPRSCRIVPRQRRAAGRIRAWPKPTLLCSSSAPAISARSSPGRRSTRATRSCSRTTGTRPTASSSPGSRSAAPGSRRSTSARASEVEQMLALEPSRVFLLAAQASRPVSDARARLHRGDERDRRAPRRRAGRARPSSSRARSTCTGRGSAATSARTRRTARRATSRTSPRSTGSSSCGMHARAPASGSRSCGSGSSTGRAPSSTTGRSRRRSWTSSAGSPRPASR